jgi:hypothetical protein
MRCLAVDLAQEFQPLRVRVALLALELALDIRIP